MHCERIHKFRETGHLRHLYWNELDKDCFAHKAAYSVSKDLAIATISDQVLKDRAYEIARNPKYYGYQRGLANIVCNFFDQKNRIVYKCKLTARWRTAQTSD